jgi:hypothetical protein
VYLRVAAVLFWVKYEQTPACASRRIDLKNGGGEQLGKPPSSLCGSTRPLGVTSIEHRAIGRAA